jgi:hypothetical protein
LILIAFSPFLLSFVLYRESAVITGAQTAIFQLPQEDLVLNKEYKITYKVRVGKGVDSGTIIELPAVFEGPNLRFDDILEVLVM